MATRQVIEAPVHPLRTEAARMARCFADAQTRLAPDFGLRVKPWQLMSGVEREHLTEVCLQILLIGGWPDV